jgi:hypothetical protein
MPVTIGGIGLREASFVGLLGGLGVGSEKALVLSFCIFGLQIIGALTGGIVNIVEKNYKSKTL